MREYKIFFGEIRFNLAVETARHLLQRGEPPQRNGSSTRAKPTSVGLILINKRGLMLTTN